MDLKSLPETIRSIIEQAGGLGLRGAFTYIGASRLNYRCPLTPGGCRPEKPSHLATESNCSFIDFDIGVSCRVNGKRGRASTLIIAYELDDTYTVWLVEGHAQRKADTMVLACHRDVYCDTLQNVIQCAYDEAITQHNSGFIPLS